MPRTPVIAATLIGLGLTLAILSSSPAQPPAASPRPLPSSVSGGLPQPTSAVAPASVRAPAVTTTEAPIRKFQPLEAYPPTTQAAMAAYLNGSAWLTRMNQPHGRFLHGYLPTLRQTMEGDDELIQAHAALALAEAAQFTGEAKYTAIASQALLTLLTATKVDPADANCRVPVPASPTCNRSAFAAVLALGLYAVPATDGKLRAEGDRLCEFLRQRVGPDGSIASHEGPREKADPAPENAGFVLQAVATSQRFKPAAWKADALKKSLTFYRAAFRSKPHSRQAATLTPAFTEWYSQTRSADAASFVLEMNDWLASLQYSTADVRRPLWGGGFKEIGTEPTAEVLPGFESSLYLRSLACACQLTRQLPDVTRFGKYRSSLLDAVTFVSGLQFTEPNTRHFENNYRASLLLGGFVLSPLDGNLRVDATAQALSALLCFLHSGAERS